MKDADIEKAFGIMGVAIIIIAAGVVAFCEVMDKIF